MLWPIFLAAMTGGQIENALGPPLANLRALIERWQGVPSLVWRRAL